MLNKLAKPRLTALEACHRPALREGQKENRKSNKMKADRMVKKISKLLPLMLISLLILTVGAITSIRAVAATNAGLMFTPNYHVSGTDPPGEESYSDSVANMIMYYFSGYGSNYGWLYNCQDSYATANEYTSDLSYAQNHYYNTVVYSKGHEWTWGGSSNHYELVANNYNPSGDQNGVRDSTMVYPNTGASDRFIVLWHCGTAMAYPSSYDSLGWEGMPYCFTHNNAMNTDGYSHPDSGVYVFMGFIWYSPEYLTGTGYGSNNYGAFVTYLYMYLLQYHYTVNQALNAASSATLGYSSFGSAPLHTGMYEGDPQMGYHWSYFDIYGDGNLKIPN